VHPSRWGPSAQWDLHHRNVAQVSRKLHNGSMSLGHLFLGFLQLVAVGAAIVFAMLLVIRFGMPQRSTIVVNRRTTD